MRSGVHPTDVAPGEAKAGERGGQGWMDRDETCSSVLPLFLFVFCLSFPVS